LIQDENKLWQSGSAMGCIAQGFILTYPAFFTPAPLALNHPFLTTYLVAQKALIDLKYGHK
jgi:hypothetical protein